MKRAIFLIIFILLLTSLASAEIIFKEQPKELYSLGEIIRVPSKVATLNGIENFLSIKLICNGLESEIHKQYLSIPAGAEQDINAAIPLTPNFIGRTYGTCSIKASVGAEYILSNEFEISNTINIESTLNKEEFLPEESIVIEGTAIKGNGENVQGFIDVIIGGEEGITVSDTVKNGYFFLNTSLPKETAAGKYLVQLEIYEKDGTGNKSNQGLLNQNIQINQVPTNLEIVFDEKEVIPGEDLKVKAVLHDQSGEKIESDVTMTLKNEKGKILEQKDLSTDEFLDYPIIYNQAPVKWEIIAESDELIVEENFNISENELAEVDIINKTVIITNKGNVPYNETVVIKVGNTTLDFDTYIEVDEIKKYSLTAPNGEYEVEIRAGEDKKTKSVLLTGSAINVKEIEGGILKVVRFPFVWIFILLILGFMLFMIFKKGYRKTFIGYITKRKAKKTEEVLPLKPIHKTLVNSKNPAILSLSIKGHKQNISLICLKIKNEKEIENNEIAKEVLEKITNLAEEHKAATYQNQNNIMFMWVPLKTKTFKNQKKAIEIAQEAKEILDKYNKLAKKRIDYGISVNYGTIITKPEKDGLKFMSMGTLITEARKLAILSTGEVYLSQKMHEQTLSDVKSNKVEKKGHAMYTVKEIKKKSLETKKFIHNFIEKLEKENKAKSKKKLGK